MLLSTFCIGIINASEGATDQKFPTHQTSRSSSTDNQGLSSSISSENMKNTGVIPPSRNEKEWFDNLDPLYYQQLGSLKKLEDIIQKAKNPTDKYMACLLLVNALKFFIDMDEESQEAQGIVKLEQRSQQIQEQSNLAIVIPNSWSEWDELLDHLIRENATQEKTSAFCAAVIERLLPTTQIKAYDLLRKCYQYTGENEKSIQAAKDYQKAYETLTSYVQELASEMSKE
jgi:hypothetical protein